MVAYKKDLKILLDVSGLIALTGRRLQKMLNLCCNGKMAATIFLLLCLQLLVNMTEIELAEWPSISDAVR